MSPHGQSETISTAQLPVQFLLLSAEILFTSTKSVRNTLALYVAWKHPESNAKQGHVGHLDMKAPSEPWSNLFRGGYIGDLGTSTGLIMGDTRSLDYSPSSATAGLLRWLLQDSNLGPLLTTASRKTGRIRHTRFRVTV